jgi:hypothetical protein
MFPEIRFEERSKLFKWSQYERLGEMEPLKPWLEKSRSYTLPLLQVIPVVLQGKSGPDHVLKLFDESITPALNDCKQTKSLLLLLLVLLWPLTCSMSMFPNNSNKVQKCKPGSTLMISLSCLLPPLFLPHIGGITAQQLPCVS